MLAWLCGATGMTGVGPGAGLGLPAAVTCVAAGGAPHSACSRNSRKLFRIDKGHRTAVRVVPGAIVGGWR